MVKKDAKSPEPLKAINVGITNDEGSVDSLMSLEMTYESGLRRPIFVGNVRGYNNGGGQSLKKTVHCREQKPRNGEAISLMDNRWKKTVIRSTRFSPVLMDMIKTECKCRRIDFSNYILFAATAAMKHNKKSGGAGASKEM